MKTGRLLDMARVGTIFFLIALFSARPAFSDKASDSIIDIQTINRELENIEKQIIDLVARQEKLLKDLESLKVIARRN